MSAPRNLYPDTTQYVTCRCVHRSFRLVPKPIVKKVLEFCFAFVSSLYRDEWGMEFYEFEFLSNHYHLVLYDPHGGKTSDFLQDLNSLIAKELNAIRGTSGAFFAREPGIQTVLGDERVFEHCIYTLANAVAAGIVRKTAHWKGFNSLRMEYRKPKTIKKPRVGIWSRKQRHKGRKGSRRSSRAAYAGRSSTPDTAILMLDRPRIRPDLEDPELRAAIRKALTKREEEIAEDRGNRPVLGMKAALKIHWRAVPGDEEELFTRRPTLSTETPQQRSRMRRLRRRFLREYPVALDRFNNGERDVVFPPGTVRMRWRHSVTIEPIPLDLLLTG